MAFETDPLKSQDDDFSFTFDEEDEVDFPALYDFTGIEEDDEAVSEFLMPDPSRIPEIDSMVAYSDENYEERPAEERINELFIQMKPYRRILYSLLEECKTPKKAAEIEEFFTTLDRDYKSTYSCSNICAMLDRAGAFDKVNEEGISYSEIKIEPDIIVEDGVEYMVAAQPPVYYFKTTEAGLAKLEEHKPEQLLQALFEKETKYLPIFKRVLTMAADEGGTSASALSYAVDADPLVQKPRFFVQHFLENLERCEAVAWQNKKWVITPLGQQALDGTLADVVDNFNPDTDRLPDDIQKNIAAEESLGAVW